MFSKSNLISTIVTAIWGLLGGFLLWGILADPYLATHVPIKEIMKQEPNMPYLALGCLIQAFAFSSIYGKFGSKNYGLKSGLSLGLLTALMVGLGEKLIDFATANIMDLQGYIINFGVYIIFFGITGILAGIVYGKTS
ncbi:MAG: hypothetical protein ACWA45_07400 [Flavobacteriales bacterium]